MEYVPVSEPTAAAATPRGGETQLVTLPVSTPPEYYRNDEGKSADEVRAAKASLSGAICRHCGVASPPLGPLCFADKNTTHEFYVKAGKEEGSKKEESPHMGWQVLWVLIILGCYTVAIIYTVIPFQKYLEQDPVTVFAARNSSTRHFPAIQICNFNYHEPIQELDAYFQPSPNEYIQINVTISPIKLEDDYEVDVPFVCHELNNVATGGLVLNSTRHKVVVVAKIPRLIGQNIPNDFCGPSLCHPGAEPNSTIFVVDPLNDALGVSIAAFTPDGVPRQEVLGTGVYLASGAYSQVSLKYSQFWKLDAEKPEETFSMTTSSVKYEAGSFSNVTDTEFFELSQMVFVQFSFVQFEYSQVNETKTYEAFNAFGDATAIVGFATGFGFFGGPTVLSLFVALASRPCWRKMFYD